MTYKGKMRGGVVVLDGPEVPPDGVQVSVRVLKPPLAGRGGNGGRASGGRFQSVAGILKGLPPDLSTNLDSYLYGVPKRK